MERTDLLLSNGHANEALLENDDGQPDYLNENARRRMLFTNFIVMSLAFSFNHGCVVSCLAYASSELGDKLGAFGGGFLYVAYSFSALALAKPVVEAVGPKFGLFIGVLGYCLYIMGFLLSVVSQSSAWGIFPIASIIGGVSGGILWTAQGKYFAANAILYADAEDKPVEEINTQFAGIFAAIYLGLEMVAGLIASGVYFGMDDYANAVVFSVYAMIAVVSVLGMLLISNLDEYGTWEFDYEDAIANATSTARLLREDSRLLLMMPYQVTFGLVSTFVPFYIFGTVVSDSDNLGEEYVGILAAVTVFAGAAVALPAAEVAKYRGKPVVMVFGAICMSMVGFVLYFVKDRSLERWRVMIPYMLIYGMGRGIWENTNKAVIADLYIHDSDLTSSAFAAVAFSSGISGATGYFLFSSILRSISATVIFTVALFALMCYINVTMTEERRLSMTQGGRRGSGSGRHDSSGLDLKDVTYAEGMED